VITAQQIETEAFAHDIDKFVMVGTPNKGSLKPYYLWEGGDPKRLDEEVNSFPPYMYSNICNNIYLNSGKFSVA